VSVVGLGEDDPTGDIVIASIATLCARRASRWWRDFHAAFGLVFFDELHHLLGLGEEWRDTALGISAARRYGLTGTLYADDPQVRLWSHALCGPVLHRTTIKRLMDAGHLTPLTIRFVRHNAPTSKERDWSPSTYKHQIVECETRNTRLVEEALAYAKQGRHVLIDVSRVGHGRELLRILRGLLRPGQAKLLTGSSSDDERREVIADFVAGKVKVLVSTFLGEGVDIPQLDVVINAEGGRASASTIQRLRNLTPFPGKEAVLIEPIDDHHQSLAEWTKERVMMYRAERCFKITIEPATDATPSRKAPVKDKVRIKLPAHLSVGSKE
jgi:superfamily II DNA or RNA helicase